MPVHDWHPNAYCGVTLFAEIEGLVDKKRSNPTSRSRSRNPTPYIGSPTSIPGTPMAGSRSSSPNRAGTSRRQTRPRQASRDVLAESGRAQGLDSVINQLEEISITRQLPPQVPAYAGGSEGTENIPWLQGLHRTTKPFEVLYNPNPTGGLTELSMQILGDQAGLGGYRLELLSEIVSPYLA